MLKNFTSKRDISNCTPKRSGLDTYNNATGRSEDVSSIFNLKAMTRRVPEMTDFLDSEIQNVQGEVSLIRANNDKTRNMSHRRYKST